MERNRDLEDQLLELAAGDRQIYRREVLARLDRFEEDDGGNLQGWDAALDQVLAEAQEEAADVSGWLLGAALHLPTEKFGRIIAAMRLASWAHREIEDLRLDLVMEGPPPES